MIRKLSVLILVFLPVCMISAQQPNTQTPPPQGSGLVVLQHPQPSPEVLRHAAEMRQRMEERSIAINDLASHIQSPDDARKLIDLVAAEFSDELPPRWMTRGIRERIARAEYAAAAEGALIPDERVAAVWNDFLEKIGAPQEDMLNAAEIHYLRDAQYTTTRIGWNYYSKNLWTVPGVFAVGPNGKVVANGSRALEAIRLLWRLGNETEDFSSIHADVQKGVLVSDLWAQPATAATPGHERSWVSVQVMSFPVRQAAFHYVQEHGERSFEHVVEGLLKDLLQ